MAQFIEWCSSRTVLQEKDISIEKMKKVSKVMITFHVVELVMITSNDLNLIVIV